MADLKLWFAMRDITLDKDFELYLPMESSELQKKLGNHEYIICDCDILECNEFESIIPINDKLNEWNDQGITNETLEILQKVFTYNEMVDHIENESYYIVDFDEETKGWCCYGDEAKGLCIHELGLYNLPFEDKYDEDMVDWIDWEQLWTNASCEGWVSVSIMGHEYLVNRN